MADKCCLTTPIMPLDSQMGSSEHTPRLTTPQMKVRMHQNLKYLRLKIPALRCRCSRLHPVPFRPHQWRSCGSMIEIGHRHAQLKSDAMDCGHSIFKWGYHAETTRLHLVRRELYLALPVVFQMVLLWSARQGTVACTCQEGDDSWQHQSAHQPAGLAGARQSR